jgi:hypothetical protein
MTREGMERRGRKTFGERAKESELKSVRVELVVGRGSS